MNRKVWDMNKKNNSIKLFKMVPLLDLNLMYTKVIELEELYLFAENHFQIHALGFKKN